MLGWKLFAKAFGLLIQNLGGALRVSLVPFLIAAVVAVLVGYDVITMAGAANPATLPDGFFWRILVLMVTFVGVYLWIAVAWHRFVLLNERGGWVPALNVPRLMGYLGQAILLMLLMIAVLVAAMLVGGLLIGGLAMMAETAAAVLAVIGYAALMIFFIALFYRLAVVLPARAIDQPLAFREAWDKTRGASGAIILMAILTSLVGIALQIPSLLAQLNGGGGFGSGLVDLVYTLVIQWFMLILGVSVLTTLYGHFVEGRSVD